MSTHAPTFPRTAPDAAPGRTATRGAALAAVLITLAWLAIGGSGTYLYAHRYWLYRGFPPPTTPAGVPSGTLQLVHFRSAALRRRESYLLYKPAGYRRLAREGRRLPVLLVLHAPPGRVDGVFKAGAMGVRADVLLHRHAIRPMLLAVPFGRTSAFQDDTEWANARAGRYEGFVMDVLRNLEHRFAAARDRAHHGLAGLSEGGYGAANVGLRHLRQFSVVQSWSGYFRQTPTGPFAGASAATLAANSPVAEVAAEARAIRRLGLHAWLYQGTKDQMPPGRIRAFARELHAAGADVHVGFFPGGHDWGLWRREMSRMLVATSRWFGRPPNASPAGLHAIGRPAPLAVRDRLLRELRARCHARRLAPGLRRPRLCGPATPGRRHA